MLGYLLRRLLASVPLLLGITVLCFGVMHLAPGDPTQLMGDFDPKAKSNAALVAQSGLNDPLPVQYLRWLGHILQGNLGQSLMPDGLPVAQKLAEALPLTLWLNGVGLLLVLGLSLPLGLWLAARAGGTADTTATVLLYLGLAAPSVWLALLGLQWFGVTLGWVPLSGLNTFGAEHWPWWQRVADTLWHLTLPLAVGLVGSLAGLTRYVRGSALAVLGQPFVLTAHAKGATPRRVWLRHTLRNALLPTLTLLGLSLPGLIGGSVILESLFGLPGMGKLFYDSVMMRDYPVVMALLLIGAALTLLGNLLADAALAAADPRVRAGLQHP
ncbi:MAG: ABC transporter permease [Alphaproteobacteria bacterium]|jgi:peptide/nickel transport system permease protein|nr:ABC transporter permease [Alphaproteobacteria bacterium]